MTCNANFSCRKAEEELGYTVRGSFRTISDTLEWYAEARPELLAPRVRNRLNLKKRQKKLGGGLVSPV